MSKIEALSSAVYEFANTNPAAGKLIAALAAWLQEVADSALKTDQLPEGPPAEQSPASLPAILAIDSPAPALISNTAKPAPTIVEVKEAERPTAELEADRAAVLARWGNPDVSPKLATPRPAEAEASKTASQPATMDFVLTRRRLRQHLRALDWAIACSQHGFDDNSAAHRELCDLGKRERIFFWEVNSRMRDLTEAQWCKFKALYAAVDEAIGLFLEEPSHRFRTAGVFRTVAIAVQALHEALELARLQGMFDSDIEALFKLCANHPTFGSTLPPAGAAILPFDPAAFSKRLRAIRAEIREEMAREKAPTQALKKLQYHLQKIHEYPSNAESEASSICAALAAWVGAGKKLSDPLLLANFKFLASPAALPTIVREHELGSQLVAILEQPARSDGVSENDADDADDEDDRDDGRYSTPDIRAVRDALRGKRVVLIGGDERPQRKAAIIRAFDLGELEWVATKPHETHDSLIGPIRDDETALVILLIRWSSHSYGEMRDVCAVFEKPLVRLPGGYNPAMIAREVIDQAGERLGILPPREGGK
jgi:hypothetical protein